MRWRRASWILALPLCVGCVQSRVAPDAGDVGEQAPSLQEDRLVINNDQDELNARLDVMARPLFVVATETPGHEVTPSRKSTGTQLTLRGQINPPIVNGEYVHANDIDISGHTAVVAYNYAGEVFAGAVQVIDFTNPRRPRLLSEVVYLNEDVTAVKLTGQNVYVGASSTDPALETPALLEEFTLGDAGLERTGRWLDMPSWTVTDLAQHGNQIIASVGSDDGGIAIVDRNGAELSISAFVPEVDVRGIDFPNENRLAAVCGTTPRMAVMDVPGFTAHAAYAVDGYNNEAAKGTIEVHASVCYLGAGDGGMQVFASDGTLLGSLNHDDFSEARPHLMVTNAVSLHGNLAFVAAGALGVQVVNVAGANGWAQGGGPDPDGLEVLGELQFDEGISSNMVKTRNNVMVVAAGAGGVKLVTMSGND